ncbi:hypothetical protein [Streptomyces sp. WAC04114]|uniref:hypothetical protein n=1 Tax=Streptomyces sp. WAC04114 TaxID=2867961 RepID=UPI001C8BAF85|nr:hypothetical protein [Streptomyces sp. WAC04114]MBX9360290.1 hypothetical protein [Streptomyces sp. WAC04114]
MGTRFWDLDAVGWPYGEIELRTYGNGHYLGRLMLTSGSGPAAPGPARGSDARDQTGSALGTGGPVGQG